MISPAQIAAASDIAGFTGTRDGLTSAQCITLAMELLPVTEFHHGDCVGADGMAHVMAALAGCRTVAHPARVPDILRAFCDALVVRESKRPLDRNRDIVIETDRLIACPKRFAEELRSGTWATIRLARRLGREITIIWPDGSKTAEPAKGMP